MFDGKPFFMKPKNLTKNVTKNITECFSLIPTDTWSCFKLKLLQNILYENFTRKSKSSEGRLHQWHVWTKKFHKRYQEDNSDNSDNAVWITPLRFYQWFYLLKVLPIKLSLIRVLKLTFSRKFKYVFRRVNKRCKAHKWVS